MLRSHGIMVAFTLACTLSLGGLAHGIAAGSKGTKSTAPTNFKVTTKTAYSVTLSWGPPASASGDFQYHLWGAYNVGPTVILPKTATSYTFNGLFPGNAYTFGIFTKDARGATSAQATLDGIRLPADTHPPTTAPIVSIDAVGANYAVLSWIPAQDNGPHLSTEIYLNGIFYHAVGHGVTNATLRGLAPATSYRLSLRAVDFGNNAGPFSQAVTLTTPPANPADMTPPTVPSQLFAETVPDGSTETYLSWTQSTDDMDAQAHLRYDVYVNGFFTESRYGSGGPVILYGEFGDNILEVYATDTAGNTSAPGVLEVFIP